MLGGRSCRVLSTPGHPLLMLRINSPCTCWCSHQGQRAYQTRTLVPLHHEAGSIYKALINDSKRQGTLRVEDTPGETVRPNDSPRTTNKSNQLKPLPESFSFSGKTIAISSIIKRAQVRQRLL